MVKCVSNIATFVVPYFHSAFLRVYYDMEKFSPLLVTKHRAFLFGYISNDVAIFATTFYHSKNKIIIQYWNIHVRKILKDKQKL